MKKSLIIGCIMVFVGLILQGISLAKVGFDATALIQGYATTTENTYIIEDEVYTVVILGMDSDVVILPSENELSRVISHDGQNLENKVTIKNGVLTINQIDSREWYDRVLNLGKNMDITIYLPEKTYESLKITTGGGDIFTSEKLTFSSVDIETKSGDVQFSSVVIEDLSILTSSGDADAKWKNTKFIDIVSDSGDIEIDALGGEKILMETTSGDISGRMFGDITFEAETRSGTINVPRSHQGEICTLRTNSGNIDIE